MPLKRGLRALLQIEQMQMCVALRSGCRPFLQICVGCLDDKNGSEVAVLESLHDLACPQQLLGA